VKSVGFDLYSQHIGTREHDLPNHALIAASYTVPQYYRGPCQLRRSTDPARTTRLVSGNTRGKKYFDYFPNRSKQLIVGSHTVLSGKLEMPVQLLNGNLHCFRKATSWLGWLAPASVGMVWSQARSRECVSLCGICGGQGGIWIGLFSEGFSFPDSYHSANVPHISSSSDNSWKDKWLKPADFPTQAGSIKEEN